MSFCGDAAKQALIRHLREAIFGEASPPRHVHLLIDAGRDDAIYPQLREFSVQGRVAGLYQGPAAAELASVAPYLLDCDLDGTVFDWFWEGGWGRSWGILIRSDASIQELRRHFRRLTQIRTEDGRVLLFRFYDPRVFAAFASSCSAEQARALFGPIGSIHIALIGNGLASFWLQDGAVRQTTWWPDDATDVGRLPQARC